MQRKGSMREAARHFAQVPEQRSHQSHEWTARGLHTRLPRAQRKEQKIAFWFSPGSSGGSA
eukprot:6193705-Pleurochrysis_carterae.AAC.2